MYITGAGSGLGRKTAILFAELGACVTCVDINLEGAQDTVDMIHKKVGGSKSQPKAISIKVDVTSVEDIKASDEISQKAFGKPVSILINNAGIMQGKNILDVNIQTAKKVFEINVLSHLYTIQQFLPNMKKADAGHIVSIVSVAGLAGASKMCDYSASKFAAFGFQESVRIELKQEGSKIKSTTFCPYFINTGMFEGVKSKYPILLPILDEDYTAQRLVNGIR